MFEQVVFAGGGNRCWWQGGFWDVIAPVIELQPKVISGISAGAATACMKYARPGVEGSEWILAYYNYMLRDMRRNVHWHNLMQPGQRVFPHYGMYREALLTIFDAEHLARLHQGPEIRIGVSHIPRWLGARSAVVAGLVAYNIEKYGRKSLHPTLGRKLGFHPEFVRVQDCQTPEELADLLLQSASTPPFTPVLRRSGRPVLDGGMVDNVPVHALDTAPADRKQNVLVMVTRPYPRPQMFTVKQGLQTRLYVQPSRPVAISSWDYTRPELMRPAYEQGREDGERFLRDLPKLYPELGRK